MANTNISFQFWLPRREQLFVQPHPQVVLARELPALSQPRRTSQNGTHDLPPLSQAVRLNPPALDLDDFRLVELPRISAEPAPPVPSIRQPRVTAPDLPEPLSERELEVLHALARGDTNRELAEALGIAIGTVRWHLTNVYGKLGVQRRTQAIARARALRLIP